MGIGLHTSNLINTYAILDIMSKGDEGDQEEPRKLLAGAARAFASYLWALTELSEETKQAYTLASGSLLASRDYYQRASGIVNIAETRGTLSPEMASNLRRTFNEWRDHDERWYERVIEGTQEDSPEKILNVEDEIENYMVTMGEQIKEIHEEIVGYKKFWKNLLDVFGVPSSEKEKTTVFRGMTHEELLRGFLEKIEKKFSGTVTHGLREAGVDLLLEVPDSEAKFGVQIKSNNDIKEKDFSRKTKAQIADSKKHAVKGLVIILCGDLTDVPVRQKVRSMISEVNLMKGDLLKAVPPEKAVSILNPS